MPIMPLKQIIAFREANADRFTLGDVMGMVEVLSAKLADHPRVPVACGDDYPLDGYFVFPEPWQVDSDTLSGIDLGLSRSARVRVRHQ